MLDKRERTVLGIVDTLFKTNKAGKKPCKKTVQKIVYLIQEAGEDLGFGYGIHFYGPYSADLDYEIQDLSASGMLAVEKKEYGHFLSVDIDEQSEINSSLIDSTIERFGNKSPAWLELLATTLFVQREKGNAHIAAGVEKIKGSKYSADEINQAISELRQAKYF